MIKVEWPGQTLVPVVIKLIILILSPTRYRLLSGLNSSTLLFAASFIWSVLLPTCCRLHCFVTDMLWLATNLQVLFCCSLSHLELSLRLFCWLTGVPDGGGVSSRDGDEHARERAGGQWERCGVTAWRAGSRVGSRHDAESSARVATARRFKTGAYTCACVCACQRLYFVMGACLAVWLYVRYPSVKTGYTLNFSSVHLSVRLSRTFMGTCITFLYT